MVLLTAMNNIDHATIAFATLLVRIYNCKDVFIAHKVASVPATIYFVIGHAIAGS